LQFNWCIRTKIENTTTGINPWPLQPASAYPKKTKFKRR